MPATEPERLVVDDYVRHLNTALTSHNASLPAEERTQLRMAVGRDAAEVDRLIGADAPRRIFRANKDAHLVLLLTDGIHADVVAAQGHTSPQEFVNIRIREKEFLGNVWVWTPRHDLAFVVRPDESRPRPILTDLYGPVDARQAVLRGGAW
ncbi:hypothetical protein ABT294_21545 [Nonomuraea sp. NPDC000554]|uniref:hypothetical protein n=1 Tax=Nonomuraea sp. NPDC000554 TaxID=3154259 RepID=UPI0033315355